MSKQLSRLVGLAMSGLSALTAVSDVAASADPPGTPAVPSTPAAAAPTAPAPAFFAVEFRTGARWDSAKPPHQQLHFADHSANLKRLRQDGRIVLGARYSDKGLVVIQAATVEEVRGLIDVDPSVQNQVFTYEVHPFQVFYPGCVPPRDQPRK